MKKLKVVLVSPEAAPFAKTGGLADVAGSLPLALESSGCHVSVFLPRYRQVRDKDFGIKALKRNMSVKLGGADLAFSLSICKTKGVDFYFIEKDEYFDREFLYGTAKEDYPDNAVRFSFFSKAVLHSVTVMGINPDIIHCNDWQTGLVPFYLRHSAEDFKPISNSRVLFTVHNLAYQGLFPKEVMPRLDIGDEFFTPETLEFYGKLSFMKAGMIYADAVSTVSKGYAREILTPEFGCGLDGLLKTRKDNLYGILNGADYSVWNPKTDGYIKAPYDEKNIENKTKCKKNLIEQMKLKIPVSAPLLGVISRLAEQKGIDIIAESADEIVKLGCGLVILGAGDEKYHKLLGALAKKYPKNIAVKIAFDNDLAHKIEAGSDIFLMPSRYEPCGLNQMYSLKYGTVPVVTAVGGLDDTIVDYTQDRKKGNGFKFDNADKVDFMNALKRALHVYNNEKREWRKFVVNAMGCDFSWVRATKEYIKIYQSMKRS
ncbi:MAG: glycogen synthase GlgA [Candidatus Omnitrophota bacterium]